MKNSLSLLVVSMQRCTYAFLRSQANNVFRVGFKNNYCAKM